jgi:fumarate reductase (CoM/CoB) subunit A
MRSLELDVIVVGAGSAGLTAALYADRAGARTLLVDKGLAGKSGSSTGAAQLAAVGPWKAEGDSVDAHFRDSVIAGRFLNDQPLVRLMVDEAAPRVQELMELGMTFDRSGQGEYVLSPIAGHSYPRSLCRHDAVGLGVCTTLSRVLRHRRVPTQPDTFVTDLIVADGRVYGAYAVDLRAGEPLLVEAGAVILAAGGAGRLYPVTTNPDQSTGDGYALAARAGVPMLDMEFYQFYPCCLVYPSALAGLALSIIEVAKLYNADGARFMEHYNPGGAERATRDVLSRSIEAEILAGRGGPHGGVFMDATGLPDDVYRMYEYDYRMCLDNGIDLRWDRAEIAPGAHYVMGGAQRDARAATSVEGLFVVGEVAGGLQGANRLGNNSIPECLVFGARAGEQAARHAQAAARRPGPPEFVRRARERVAGVAARVGAVQRPFQVQRTLAGLMSEQVGVRRSASGLARASDELARLAEQHAEQTGIATSRLRFNGDLVDYFEVDNLLLSARLIVRAALSRRESRGAHFVEDWPASDATWLRHVVVEWRDGTCDVRTTPVAMTELRPEPHAGAEEGTAPVPLRPR